MYDFLIVGAGFTGCVLAERITSELGKKVLIVDKRDHIGGNAYDYYNNAGVLIHKYGPHWFHTNDSKVFKYLSRFTEWINHYHVVKASVNGTLCSIPINMDTLNHLYGMNLSSPAEVQQYYDSVRDKSISKPANAEEMVISLVGNDLYEKFFKGYTIKQWEIDPKELDASVTARIPVRTNRDERYFTDYYQVMPKFGYSELFKRMTENSKISFLLKTDYKTILDTIKFDKLIYSGPIDEYFDFQFGKLPYRSLRFEHETYYNTDLIQSHQQINYPNEFDFTRIVEWKHATHQKSPNTTITKEYSYLARDNDEKYYPIPRQINTELFNKYRKEAEKLKNVFFCGRLADYKYYNMDQVVARALSVFEKQISA